MWLWDRETGKPVGPPVAYNNFIWAAAFQGDGKTLVTAHSDQGVRQWTVVEPLPGTTERLVLWTQVLTTLELDPGGGARVLTAKEWRERRRRLQELGGPPVQ
jgi:hypothetical protein